MKKISARGTWFGKRVLPVLWFSGLGVILAAGLASPHRTPALTLSLAIPVAIAIYGYILMKRFVWNLADEVYDCGDHLLVRNGEREHHVPLSDIMNVSAATLSNPPRVTLKLATPHASGSEIHFLPVQTFTFNPFAKNAVVEDLIVRVDAARVKRAR